MKKRTNKKTIIYFVITWIILAFLLESTDLWISINLYNPDSSWALFVERFGEIPGLLTVLIGTHIYIVTLRTSSNSKMILFTAFLLTTASLLTVYILFVLSNSIYGNFLFFDKNMSYFFIASVIANILITYFLRKRYQFSKKVILFSRISFKMFLFGYLLYIQPLKWLWGRIRFRDLAGDYSHFSAWYLPQGFNGNDSFPSGHAAMGWILLSLFVLFVDRPQWKRLIVKISVISWALVVCISRVIIGAHYTSDVVFASLGMIIAYLLILKHVTKNLKPDSE